MKIIVFLLTVLITQVNANSFAQKITLSQRNITFEQFFREIKVQTGYNVFYSDRYLNNTDKIKVKFKSASLEEVLREALANHALTFVISEKDIMIKPKPAIGNRLIEAFMAIDCRGRIVDKDGLPLPGASVSVKGTKKVAVANANGEFSLSNVNEDAIIVVSFIGYVQKELKAGRDLGNIILETSDAKLEEVQVIAFGAQKKITVTGAISSIGSKELLRSPNGSIGNILAGTMSGITTVQYSAQPGADDPDIFVRGTASLDNERSKPLILVDGVERSFFRMDPNEIESVTVLKDASATAVFGVRGANGVILVTTKRGKEGRTEISFSTSAGISQPLRLPEMANSYDNARFYNEMELSDNPNLAPTALRFSPYVLEAFRTGSDPIMFPNTNWEDMLFKSNSIQTQNNVTISGGTKNVRFFTSIGSLYQEGLLKRHFEDYDPNYRNTRYNYRTNLDIDLTKSTLLKLNIGGRLESRFEPNNNIENNNLWTEILRSQPYASPGFVDGKLIINSSLYIPTTMRSGFMGYYGKGYRRISNNALNLDLVLNQKLDFITKGLSFETKGAYNTTYDVTKTRAGSVEEYNPIYKSTIQTPTLPITDPNFDRSIVYRQTGSNNVLSYGEGYNKFRDWYFDLGMRYDRTYGDHSVGGLLLYNMSKTYYPAAYTDIPRGYLGLVARTTYSYKNRYMLDLNAGYNGSENFAKGSRYGFFPAVSAGWVLSEEKFMDNLKFIDLFKLRASYGIVGNDILNSASRFLYLPDSYNASTGGYYFGENTPSMYPGVRELMLGNPDVTWEKSAKQNYGVDITLFNQRLTVTADVFYEKRKDILIQQNTVPSVVAATLPAVNIGKVNNQGYEVSVGWNGAIAEAFRYRTRLNVSYARNEIIYRDEIPQTEDYLYETGRPTGLNKGYLFDRFFNASDFNGDGTVLTTLPRHPGGGFKPGDVMFKDLNGDQQITGEDMTYFGYSENPNYIYGLNAGFEFKNFDFSMTWTAATNVSRRFEEDYTRAFNTGNAPLMQFMIDERWTPERGESATFPRFTNNNRGYNALPSSFWVRDASYIRLKNVEVGYSFRPAFLKKIGVQRLRVYTNGYNLLTFDDLEFIDPESKVGNKNKYPNSRILNMGLNVNF